MEDLKGAPSLQVRIQRDKSLMRGKRASQTQRKLLKTIWGQQRSLSVIQIQKWLSSMQRRVAMNKLLLRCSQWLWTKICWKNRRNSSRQILMLVRKWPTICGLQCSFSSEEVCRKKPLMACAKLPISPSELPHIFLLNLRRIFPISIYKFSRLIWMIKDQDNPLISKSWSFSLVMYWYCWE